MHMGKTVQILLLHHVDYVSVSLSLLFACHTHSIYSLKLANFILFIYLFFDRGIALLDCKHMSLQTFLVLITFLKLLNFLHEILCFFL